MPSTRWIDDDEALDAFQALARLEGILPALESAHAVAYAMRLARRPRPRRPVVLVNLSGRGDKDVQTVRTRAGGGAMTVTAPARRRTLSRIATRSRG